MKYLKLFENFESYDPYELMMVSPNKKAEMIKEEIKKSKPNLNLIQDLITLGANLDWQIEEEFNYTLFHWATIDGELEIVKMLIDAKANPNLKNLWGWTALHCAAMYNKVEIARMLIDAGANVNITNKEGWTALHEAARKGHTKIAHMLIDAGTKLNVQDEDGWTSLHMASRYGSVEIVRILIDAGARTDIATNGRELPYDLAQTEEMKKLLQP